MNSGVPSDSEKRSDLNPTKPTKTLADLQVHAYENRVRERFMTKYPTPTPAEARRLEKQIEKLVQIYAQGRIFLQGVPSDATYRNHKPQAIAPTRETGVSYERE
jgi:hypothetical protein